MVLHVGSYGTMVVFGLAIALMLSKTALSAERHVPGSYASIQAAIDAADSGDEIILAPGVYTGPGNHDLETRGLALVIRRADCPDPNVRDPVVIDPNGAGRAFHIHEGEIDSTVISGLVIRDGTANRGGGIYCEGTSPTIQNCTIVGNTATDAGGGICCDGGTPRILNCTIAHNASPTVGGVYCSNTSQPTVTNCILWGNQDDDGVVDSSQIGGPGQPEITYSCIEGSAPQPIYWWDFDEGASPYAERFGALPDAIGVSTVAVATVPNAPGSAVGFPQGSSAYVNLGSWQFPSLGGSFELWINPEPFVDPGLHDQYHVMVQGSGSLYLTLMNDGTLLFGNAGGVLNANYAQSMPGALTFDGWQHLVVCWDLTEVSFYVNGVQANTAFTRGTVRPSETSQSVYLGRSWGSGRWFRGGMDGFKVHDHALSAEEVAAAYALQGCEPSIPGVGNLSANPLFVDPDGPDDDPGTVEDNDYHLSGRSPCLDAGTAVTLPGSPAIPSLWWDFDESASPYAERNGVLSPATGTNTASVTGESGNAVSFLQGANSYVDLGTFDLPEHEGTLDVWLKPDAYTTQNHYQVFVKGYHGQFASGWAFEFRIYDDGRMTIGSGLGGDSCARSESGVITTGVWQRVTATWSPGGVCFYVDGSPVGIEWTQGVVRAAQHASMPVALAKWGATYYPEAAYRGALDELKIYDWALSESEINEPSGDVTTLADIDGHPRPNGARVDIGSDEYYCPPIFNATQGSYHETIQQAIDAANANDELILEPGRYTGPENRGVDPNGLALTIRSTDPNDPNIVDDTIIDADCADRVFVFQSGESAATVIAGITLLNGRPQGGDEGGGVLCSNSSPTISRCVIRGCEAGSGAGVCCDSASPLISNCTIEGNLADYGGGFYCEGASQPQILHSIFRHNAASSGAGVFFAAGQPHLMECRVVNNVASSGAGILCASASSPIIDECFIYHNAWGQGAGVLIMPDSATTLSNCWIKRNYGGLEPGGAGIHCQSDAAMVRNCLINWNIGYDGSGIGIDAGASPTIQNCTISNNWSVGKGGGVYVGDGACHPGLRNCILWGNRSGYDYDNSELAQVYHVAGYEAMPTLIDLSHCCIQNWTGHLGGVGNTGDNPGLSLDGHLLAGSACIDAGDPGDGLDPNVPGDVDGDSRIVAGRIDIGADEYLDTDADAMPDWFERQCFDPNDSGDPNVLAEPNADRDGDGVLNGEEYRLASCPNTPPFWVDGLNGSDDYDGLAETWDGTHGPKKTLQAGLHLADDGDTVLVAPGTYSGEGNTFLDFHQSSIILRNAEGTWSSATIDCEDATRSRAVAEAGLRYANPVIDGFTIRDGNTELGGGIFARYARLGLRSCLLESNTVTQDGGGLYGEASSLLVDGLDIGSNVAPAGAADSIYLISTEVNLRGDLNLLDVASVVDLIDVHFDGPGTIRFDPNATESVLRVQGWTVSNSDIDGPADVEIGQGQALLMGGGAVLDLHRQPGDEPALAAGGRLFLEGPLTAIEGVTVRNATIWSNGVWYEYLDPSPSAPNRPSLENCWLHVTIPPETTTSHGTLLELRGRDYEHVDPNTPPPPGMHQISPSSPGFTTDPSENWVLERLELEEDARLNLTNRQGMDFQDDPNFPHPEALYVKEVVLFPNAVLNTGLQSLYYQSLVLVDSAGQELARDPDPNDPNTFLVNGSEIVDIPLLGFSLGMIAMEDDVEFDTRVATRVLQDPTDDPGDASSPMGSITREDDPNLGGVMVMRTQASGHPSADSVLAKATFAPASEEEVTVIFLYRFIATDPNTELIVYLTDQHDFTSDPDHRVEVARVYPPLPGRPGATDSSEYGVFYLTVPRGDLDFARGTFVELELRGTAACCWIDNWDPQIICNAYYCGDLNGDENQTQVDYLFLLAEYGAQVNYADPNHPIPPKYCVDFNVDGYVDLNDLWAFEAALAGVNNICGVMAVLPGGGGGGMVAGLREAPSDGISGPSLWISGKVGGDSLADALYSFGLDGGGSFKTACCSERDKGNGPTVEDADGTLYQLHAELGLVRHDGTVVVAPALDLPDPDDPNRTINVGVTHLNDDTVAQLPLIDAAFDPDDANIVFVLPVVVEPHNGHPPYKAAARLELTGGGSFDLLTVYGLDPLEDPCRTAPGEPDVQQLRDVEIDSQGNVLVLSAQAITSSNNWVLVYDKNAGTDSEHRIQLNGEYGCVPDLHCPTALTISSDPNVLYLASSRNVEDDPSGLTTRVCRLAVQRSGGAVVDLLETGSIDIVNPEPNNSQGYGFASAITDVAEGPSGELYVLGFSAPRFSEEYNEFPNCPFVFTTPTLAEVPAGAVGSVIANPLACADLALPLSVCFAPGTGQTYTLNVSINDEERGIVSIEPNQTEYAQGAEVELTAIPADGRSFYAWNVYDPNHPGDANHVTEDTNEVLHLTMIADWEVEAVFNCGSGLPPVLPIVIGAVGLSLWLRRARWDA